MHLNPDDRAELIAAYITRYRAGEIGPITFQAFLVRVGIVPTEAASLAAEHRPVEFKRYAL